MRILLWRHFKNAVIGDNPERKKKPAPDNIFEILKLLSSDKAKTLYVGRL